MTMKRIITLVVTLVAFLSVAEFHAEAQFLKNLFKKSETKTTTVSPTVNGQAAGAALKSLYGQYKVDGKLDMSNLTNIMNLSTLAQNVQGLKGQTNKSAFYKDFASGLILGSNNLVTAANSTNVMNGLSNLVNNVDLSGLIQKKTSEAVSEKTAATAEKATTAINNATEIANSVTNILSLFKK